MSAPEPMSRLLKRRSRNAPSSRPSASAWCAPDKSVRGGQTRQTRCAACLRADIPAVAAMLRARSQLHWAVSPAPTSKTLRVSHETSETSVQKRSCSLPLNSPDARPLATFPPVARSSRRRKSVWSSAKTGTHSTSDDTTLGSSSVHRTIGSLSVPPITGL